MKKTIYRILFILLLILILGSFFIFSLANLILETWWIYSLNIINSIFKIFLLRWLSVPILASVFTVLSTIHLISASKEEIKNKKLLIVKSITIFIVMMVSEYYIQFSQSFLNIILGGFTGVNDPLLGYDLSFYLFLIPLLQKLSSLIIIFHVVLLVFRLFTNSLYKIKTIHFVDKLLIVDTLFWIILLAIINQFENIHTNQQEYIGYLDIYGNLVPYIISLLILLVGISFIIFIPRKKIVLYTSCLIIILFLGVKTAWPWYLQRFVYTPNQSSLQEKFAGIHAESTRRSFGLQNIFYTTNSTIKQEELSNELDKSFWQDENQFLEILQQNQEILPIFQINSSSPILLSNENGEFSPYMIAARESSVNPSELWDIQYFRNIFGYGAVIGAANRFTQDGFAELILRDLTLTTKSINIPIKNPHIFFSESQNTPAFVNTSMLLPNLQKESFPLETAAFENIIGIPVNLFTKILLSIIYKDSRFLLTDYFLPNSKFIYQRQPKKIAKTILPQFEYSNPSLQYVNGEFWWEMDAYTLSQSVYSSKSITTPWGEYNWVQSPMKVFVSAYSGEVILDVFEPNNPYVRIAQKLYPQLFTKQLSIPKEQYLYPKDLFQMQSVLLQTYHETNSASFYSKINQREINSLSNNIDYNYKMLINSNKIALEQTYTPVNKKIFVALFSAHIGDNKQKALSIYTAPARLGIPGVAQAISFLNQDPSFSQKSTLWGQGGSRISSSKMIFYPVNNKGIYANTIYLESEQNSTPLPAQFTIIDGVSVSLGSTIDQAIFSALRSISPNLNISQSKEQKMKTIISEAYQYYLQAEQARLNEDTQEYQNNVDKIGVALQALSQLNLSNK